MATSSAVVQKVVIFKFTKRQLASKLTPVLSASLGLGSWIWEALMFNESHIVSNPTIRFLCDLSHRRANAPVTDCAFSEDGMDILSVGSGYKSNIAPK